MKLIVLTVFIAAVTCSPLSVNNNSQLTELPWEVSKLYKYDVYMFTVAQFEESAYSGSAFKANLIVRVKKPNELWMKLENPQHALVHQKNMSIDHLYKPIQNLDFPFEVTLNDGKFVSMKLPSGTSLAQENLLKAFLSALQVLKSHEELESSDYNQGQYSVMEEDVTGKCETLYTLSPVAQEWRRSLPKYATDNEPFEIFKSKNYGYCQKRVEYHFGVPKEAEWTGTAAQNPKKEQFLTRSTTTRMIVGKQGPIYKSETINIIHVNPLLYGEQKAMVLSNVTLKLHFFGHDTEGDWPFSHDKEEIFSLLYSLNRKTSQIEPQRKHHSYNDYSHSKSSDSYNAFINEDLPNDSEPAYAALYMSPQMHIDRKQSPMDIQMLLQDIAQQLQNPNNMLKGDALSKFNILVQIISTMSYSQLSQTSQNIEVAINSDNIIKIDMWLIYRDAMVQAGTLPAYKQIIQWIKDGKLKDQEAAQIVASLPNTIRYPTKELMNDFMSVAQTYNQINFFNTSALVAAAKLIHKAFVDKSSAHSFYPTHMYGMLGGHDDDFVLSHLKALKSDLVNILNDNAVEGSAKAQTLIKAIGYLGHPAVLDVFAPYISGKITLSKYLRSHMIRSLETLAEQREKNVLASLYNIILNTAEPYEVRVSALDVLLIGYPSSEMMQSLADMSNDDPSMELRSALKSSIESAAELQHPRYLELSRLAKAVRYRLTKENFGLQNSRKQFLDAYDFKDEYGILGVVTQIGSNDILIPKYLKAVIRTNVGGWDNPNSIEGSFSSLRHFLDYILTMNQTSANSKKHYENELDYSVDKVSKMLKFKHDREDALEGALYINLLNQELFFPVGETEMKLLPSVLGEYLQNLAQGIEFHYTKILNQAQVSIMFPTATGMPFVYKYKEPTLIHIKSKVKGQMNPLKPEDAKLVGQRFMLSASMDYEMQLTFARNMDGSVGFLDTLSDQHAHAGVINKVQIYLPIKTNFEMKSGEVKMKIQSSNQAEDNTLCHYSTWPYTANQNKDSIVPVSQDSSTKLVQRPKKEHYIDYTFGQAIGSPFQLKGYSYSEDYKNLGSIFTGNGFLSPTLCPIKTRQRDLALTYYNLKHLIKSSPNKVVTMTFVYDKYYNLLHGTQLQKTTSDMADIKPNSENRRQEILKRALSGMNVAQGQVLDVSATFEGAQKHEYLLTTALTQSYVDNKSQFYVFVSRNSATLGNTQANGFLTISSPLSPSMNYLEVFKKKFQIMYEGDINLENSNIHVNGVAERSQKYEDNLKNNVMSKQCEEEMTHNNYYGSKCEQVIALAHTPNYLTASLSYTNLNPTIKNITYHAYRFANTFGYWYSDINLFNTTADGKLEMSIENSYLDDLSMNTSLHAPIGAINVENVPIPKGTVALLTQNEPLKFYENILNYYTNAQYYAYCTIDDNIIKTFSNRWYNYILTPSWHVAMYDDAKRYDTHGQEIIVLTRKPKQNQQNVYIMYKSKQGKSLELNIVSGLDNKPELHVKTNFSTISDSPVTTYWDEENGEPVLTYFYRPEGVLMFTIQQDYFHAMHDGDRFVLFTQNHRNQTKGLCGRFTGDSRDDYMTQYGTVDRSDFYGAAFALTDMYPHSSTLELQSEISKWAYSGTTTTSIDEDSLGLQEIHSTLSTKNDESCLVQKNLQGFMREGKICITDSQYNGCPKQCKVETYLVKPLMVECRNETDTEFHKLWDDLQKDQSLGEMKNLTLLQATKYKLFRVPESCKHY